MTLFRQMANQDAGTCTIAMVTTMMMRLQLARLQCERIAGNQG
jgi:hypothetical protein